MPLGIIPAYGGAVRLARYVGRGKAMEMVLLGELSPLRKRTVWGS